MNTATKTDEKFVPSIYKGQDGSIVFDVTPTHGIDASLVLNRELCYVRGGRVLAIVRFDVGEQGLEAASSGMTFKAYYADGVLHPEYFDTLTAIDVAVMKYDGVFVDLVDLALGIQILRVVDMRESEIGHDYFIAVPKDGDKVSFQHSAYVFDEAGATSKLLSYAELMQLITDRHQADVPTWFVNQPLPSSERLSMSAFYEQGGRVMIEDYSSVTRSYDSSKPELDAN